MDEEMLPKFDYYLDESAQTWWFCAARTAPSWPPSALREPEGRYLRSHPAGLRGPPSGKRGPSGLGVREAPGRLSGESGLSPPECLKGEFCEPRVGGVPRSSLAVT